MTITATKETESSPGALRGFVFVLNWSRRADLHRGPAVYESHRERSKR